MDLTGEMYESMGDSTKQTDGVWKECKSVIRVEVKSLPNLFTPNRILITSYAFKGQTAETNRMTGMNISAATTTVSSRDTYADRLLLH